jgi:DNA anti-recombination protein RmuC
MGNKSKSPYNAGLGPLTKRQQAEEWRRLKADEIANLLADKIQEAVKHEVGAQLETIRSTLLSSIDRIVGIENKVAEGVAKLK